MPVSSLATHDSIWFASGKNDYLKNDEIPRILQLGGNGVTKVNVFCLFFLQNLLSSSLDKLSIIDVGQKSLQIRKKRLMGDPFYPNYPIHYFSKKKF